MNESTGIFFTHDTDFIDGLLTDKQKEAIDRLENNGSSYRSKRSPNGKKDEILTYALIMNLSANSVFLKRCDDNFVH